MTGTYKLHQIEKESRIHKAEKDRNENKHQKCEKLKNPITLIWKPGQNPIVTADVTMFGIKENKVRFSLAGVKSNKSYMWI